MKSKRNGTLPLGLIAAAAVTLSTPVMAADYDWTFQTSTQAGDNFFPFQQGWARAVEECSGGKIAIQVLPTGSVVQYNETLDAISTGILTGHITDPSYFAGKDAAYALIGNMVGAWEDPAQMRKFLAEGGGYEIYRKLLEQYNLYLIDATSTGVEALVSKVPIRGVADLKGVKLRAPEGLVNDVFAAAGATPVNLPGSEVFTALQQGVIDAADYTVFSTNHGLGFHAFARYPLYPGFHSMPMMELAINLDVWGSLSEDLQQCLVTEAANFSDKLLSELSVLDEAAAEEAKAEGVEVIDWSPEERKKFREIAQQQWAKWAERSAIAQEWNDAVTAWLKEQGAL
jgi:TRAP-type mannitol/chloroaromatic compound transport system substrate-binding protein